MTQEHLRVCTLTLNNEGGMDQDPIHTTERLIYYQMYIMSQCRNVMLSRGTSILTLMNIECCTSHSVLYVQVAVKQADQKDDLIWQ